MTRDTPIYIASVTKLYTAVVIMRLHEEGKLSLDDPMSKYLPGDVVRGIHVCRGKDNSRQVTVRQLLSHSSGIADYYSERGKDGKDLLAVFLQNPDRRWTVDETIERAYDAFIFQPLGLPEQAVLPDEQGNQGDREIQELTVRLLYDEYHSA